MARAIYTLFKGFNLQLKYPKTSEEELSQALADRIGSTLKEQGINFSNVKINFPEQASAHSGDDTDLVEVEIETQDDISTAKAWGLKYEIDKLDDIRYVEPRIALLDTTRAKLQGLPPQVELGSEVDDTVLRWHLRQTDVEAAWKAYFEDKHKQPGSGVTIALPDTGYLFHPALYNVLTDGLRLEVTSFVDFSKIAQDFIEPDNNAFLGKGTAQGNRPNRDRFGHGVSTAGLIFSPQERPNDLSGLVGHSWDGIHIPGIAPYAKPLFLRIARSDDEARGLEFFAPPLGAAIHHAIERKVNIIAISMGGYPTLTMRRAIVKAQRQGIIVIASAGNNVPFTVWPGAYKDVIAVASSTAEGRRARHSAQGTRINIAAPGQEVWCAVSQSLINHSSAPRSGTSFATPIVAGIAALWLSHHTIDYLSNKKYADRPEAIPIAFNYLLDQTCDRWNEVRCGPGIINAEKLLAAPLPDIITLEAAGLLVSQRAPYLDAERQEYLELDEGGIRTFIQMFVEPDGFEAIPVVSDAETMLNYINPDAERPQQTAVLMQMWQTIFCT
jgi:serine protease